MSDEVEIARIVITHQIADDDTYLVVDKPDEIGLVEALGMLEMAKVTLLDMDADE